MLQATIKPWCSLIINMFPVTFALYFIAIACQGLFCLLIMLFADLMNDEIDWRLE